MSTIRATTHKLIIAAACLLYLTIMNSPGSAAESSQGKELFADPKLGGGSLGLSCNSCHPEGDGLGTGSDLEQIKKIVNHCIKKDMNGQGIPPDSNEMNNLISYIVSIRGNTVSAGTSAALDCLKD